MGGRGIDGIDSASEAYALLDPAITPDTLLFRVIDFYSAAQLLESGRLRLTRMTDFEDRNEGVSHLISTMLYSALGPSFTPEGLTDAKSIEPFIQRDRLTRFVSCWTRTPESHAIWGLYSVDKSSVRIQTTAGKLHLAAQNCVAESWRDATDLVCTSHLISEASVEPVKYVFLAKLLSRLARRQRLANRLVQDRVGKLHSPSIIRSRDKWEPLTSGFVKDVAFEYEAEVRLSVALSPIVMGVVDQLKRIEDLSVDTRGAALQTFRGYVRRMRDMGVKEPPSHIEARVPPNFIESIAVDPRAPSYKRAFIERHFTDAGIDVLQASSFNSAAHERLEADFPQR